MCFYSIYIESCFITYEPQIFSSLNPDFDFAVVVVEEEHVTSSVLAKVTVCEMVCTIKINVAMFVKLFCFPEQPLWIITVGIVFYHFS